MIRSYSFNIHLQTITICSKGCSMCLKCPSIKRIMLFYMGKENVGFFLGLLGLHHAKTLSLLYLSYFEKIARMSVV